jgi:hypothetical protein
MASGRRLRALMGAMRRWHSATQPRHGRMTNDAQIAVFKLIAAILASWIAVVVVTSLRHKRTDSLMLTAARLFSNRALRLRASAWRCWAGQVARAHRGDLERKYAKDLRADRVQRSVGRAADMLFRGRRFRSLSSSLRKWQAVLEKERKALRTARRILGMVSRGSRWQVWRAWSQWHRYTETTRSLQSYEIAASHIAVLNRRLNETSAKRAARLFCSKAMRLRLAAWRCWLAHTRSVAHELSRKHSNELRVCVTGTRRMIPLLMVMLSTSKRSTWRAWSQWRFAVEREHRQNLYRSARSVAAGLIAARFVPNRAQRQLVAAWASWLSSIAHMDVHGVSLAMDVSPSEGSQSRRANAVAAALAAAKLLRNRSLRRRAAAWRHWTEVCHSVPRNASIVMAAERAVYLISNRSLRKRAAAWRRWTLLFRPARDVAASVLRMWYQFQFRCISSAFAHWAQRGALALIEPPLPTRSPTMTMKPMARRHLALPPSAPLSAPQKIWSWLVHSDSGSHELSRPQHNERARLALGYPMDGVWHQTGDATTALSSMLLEQRGHRVPMGPQVSITLPLPSPPSTKNDLICFRY